MQDLHDPCHAVRGCFVTLQALSMRLSWRLDRADADVIFTRRGAQRRRRNGAVVGAAHENTQLLRGCKVTIVGRSYYRRGCLGGGEKRFN